MTELEKSGRNIFIPHHTSHVMPTKLHFVERCRGWINRLFWKKLQSRTQQLIQILRLLWPGEKCLSKEVPNSHNASLRAEQIDVV